MSDIHPFDLEQGVSESFVSITRIQKFLSHPELPDSSKIERGNYSNKDVAISISSMTCYWNQVNHILTKEKKSKKSLDDGTMKDELVTALSNVSIDFRRGELTCIIGTVGCGKSALLQAIVGELPVFSGNIRRSYNTLAYAAQDPWIMDGTVKENIIMGMELDQEWYDKVVDACGLRLDFGQFLIGDQTIVGDRGIQCSGGQRARIGLARALYRDADVLVADDPLSAVDAKVGRQLFNEALLELAVNRGKCVILATHQHQYVSDYTCVLVSGGKIETIGSYSDCVAATGGKLTAHAADGTVDTLETGEKSSPKKANNGEASEKIDNANKAAQESKEDKVSGGVKIDTYKNYAKSMGGIWIATLLLLLFIITQGTVLCTVTMMGRWAERPPTDQNSGDILGLVIGLGVAVWMLAFGRASITFFLTIKASQRLHDRMTKAVLRAKVSFFDTNPMGRILNRFSADVGSNDDLLPHTLYDFFVLAFVVVGAVCTAVVVLPFALFAMPPLIWYFWSVRSVFVTSSRELKRLEGLARSPIFAMLSEALSGGSTIRANNSTGYFKKKFENAHNAHTRAFFSFIASSRWVGFRMDSLMFLLVAMVSFLSVLFQELNWYQIDPSILGLSLSMLLQLAGLFQWCIRQSAEVVNLMVAVERVLGFAAVESEAMLELDSDRSLDESWPSQGAIDVKDLRVRYRPSLPLALDNATFSIPCGSRIGVVGRTGSGKSTIVQTLFRLLEAESGLIKIDGVDISKVGLHRLRTKISVIPQVPTLFSGCSIRENLDLFGIHSEQAIKNALADVYLSEAITELPKGIDSMVSEGGTNFSVGQRQLLCLARAILSKNKLLVLDEATASVDRRTDQMLHESLHKSFSDATIVAVAHRLDTVVEHDYILVLGQGKVLEFGSPAELLRNGGTFSKMVEDTGDTMSKDLKMRAFAKEKRDKN